MSAGLRIGQTVTYQVARDELGGDGVPAQVLGFTKSRIIIEYAHWSDGRLVRSAVRPYRIAEAAR